MSKVYETRSREFGKLIFFAPSCDEKYSGYVWVDGPAFSQRKQICHGGGFTGETVQATQGELKSACQKWLRQRRESKEC